MVSYFKGKIDRQLCIPTYAEKSHPVSEVGLADGFKPCRGNRGLTSYCGLGVNLAVMVAFADRLAQAERAWKPFERTGVARVDILECHGELRRIARN